MGVTLCSFLAALAVLTASPALADEETCAALVEGKSYQAECSNRAASSPQGKEKRNPCLAAISSVRSRCLAEAEKALGDYEKPGAKPAERQEARERFERAMGGVREMTEEGTQKEILGMVGVAIYGAWAPGQNLLEERMKEAVKRLGGETEGEKSKTALRSTLTDLRDRERRLVVKNDDKPLLDLGRQYLDAGSLPDAKRMADRAIALNPKGAGGYALRSYANLSAGLKAAAQADARKASVYDPKNELARAVEAHIQAMERPIAMRKEVAMPDFAGRRDQSPSAGAAQALPSVPAGARRAHTPGQGAAAAPASATSPVMALLQRARGMAKLKDYSGAALAARQAADHEPGNAASWALLAEVSAAAGNHEGALQAAGKALSLDPDNAQALRARAYALLQSGRYAEALLDAHRAVELEADNALGYLYRAMALEKLGRLEEAATDYERAARLDATLKPVVEEALRRLGRGPARGLPGGPPRPWLLRGGLALASLLLVIVGLAGSSAGRRLTKETLKRLTGAPAPSPGRTLPPGTVLGGHFRVTRELGRGGMGIVYEAHDEALERRVAVKQLRRGPEPGRADWERFLREARLVAKLRHPNLAQIHSLVEAGELYLIFEYVEGRTLSAVLERKGPFSPAEARRVLAQVCGALDYAHGQRIIHKDLKPSNIMVGADGSCKVMDFGIAHQARGSASHTQTAASGTPPYMPPEQAMGSVSPAADLYALGVLAYELLTGHLPFTGPDYLGQKLARDFTAPSALVPALPKALDGFFMAALDPDPAKRPAPAAAFLRAFDQACRPSVAS